MVVEAPISLAGIGPALVRLGVRVMGWPRGIIGLWAHAKSLRQHFDNTESERDTANQWAAIEGAADILARLKIPYPDKVEGPSIWRAFLARIVVAADDADIKRARAVMDNEDEFRRAAAAEDIRLNLGDGDLLVKFILKWAISTKEVQSLYNKFKEQPSKTFEPEAFAAYFLKMYRLLDVDSKDDEEQKDWWWDFYREAETLESPDEAKLSFDRLEQEYPE